MRTKILGILLVLGVCLPLYAKKNKPVPDSILSAKTIYVINEADSQSVGDAAYEQLEKWGRYKVVHERKSADLVVHYFQTSRDVAGQTHNNIRMYVTTADSDDRLYQAPLPIKFSFASIARAQIDDFRKWVEGK